MKRRLIALALGLALVGVAAWAYNAHYSSGTAGIAATDANTNTAFVNNHSGGDSAAFNATKVLIRNRSTSASPVFFDLGDGVATTADTRLAPDAWVIVPYDGSKTGGDGYARIGLICAAAGTATVDVDAWR